MQSREWTRLPALVPVSGLAWWLIGYMPWIVTGLNGRSQNLPDAGSGVAGTALALPLTNGSYSLLAAGALVGGVAAGFTGLLVPRGRVWPSLASLVGVAAALTITLTQSVGAVREAAAGTFAADDRVVYGLVLAVVSVTAVGWLVGASAILGRPALGVALAVLAGAVPAWVWSVVAAIQPGPMFNVSPVVHWIGAAVLVVALVVIGVRPPTRIAAWPVALVLAWLVGPALTAAGYLEQLVRPAAIRPDGLPDAFAATWQVFTLAVQPANRPSLVAQWIVAVVLAAAVSAFAVSRIPGFRGRLRVRHDSGL